jgi:Ca2+-transporting ATPase
MRLGRIPREYLAAPAGDEPEHGTLRRLDVLRNRPLLLALAIAIALQVAVIHLPFLHLPFNTVPMDGHERIIAITLGVSVFLT